MITESESNRCGLTVVGVEVGEMGSAYAICSFRISSDVSSGLVGGRDFSRRGPDVGIKLFLRVVTTGMGESGVGVAES